jgi:transcriptional regulator, AbrB family
MATTLTIKGQVTIPKKVRDALQLLPGDGVEFAFNEAGQIIVHKAGQPPRKTLNQANADRFEAVRGAAQIKWRTDELMALLRQPD